MCQLATTRQYAGPLPLAVADVVRLPFADDAFDAYVSLGVIEHFETGFQHVLDEARRVLKPQGLIFVSVPHYYFLRRLGFPRSSDHVHRRARGASLDGDRPDPLFYQYVFTKAEIVQSMRDAGFAHLDTAFSNRLRWFLNLGLVRKWRARLRASPDEASGTPDEASGKGDASPAGDGSASAPVEGRRRARVREWLKSLALFVQRFVPGWLSGHTIVVVGRLE